MLEKLEHYLKTTPKEELDKEWEKLKEWNEIGPDAIEYCEYIRKNFQNEN